MLDQKVMDGNEAAAYVAYAFTEIAAIYPITPSSPMAEKTDEWSAAGKKNIFGQPVSLTEMQSEAGAVGALHGALETGAYATSYTSSQGLLLMIPVLHRIAGSRLPAVLHVASRTVGTHAMSIFGDHSDVMNCRQTGFAMLSSSGVQEVMDLGAVTHLSAIKCKMPFMHFFDGFRTSHEIQKIKLLDYEDLSGLVDQDAIDSFRRNALNPDHPTLRNTVQNPDVYFQIREANNIHYDSLPELVEEYMEKINALTGNHYALFNYYGAPDVDRVVIAMGSVSGAIQETVERLNVMGEKVGFIQVHLYRPFSVRHFLDAMPETVKTIAVLDRTKESGAVGEPLYQDICSVYANRSDSPVILGGRYGLSSKDTTPKQIKAVFDNMKSQTPQNPFTIGIVDDVSFLSLPDDVTFSVDHSGISCCKFWGLGSDGTVGANKNSVKIIGENTENYVQAYFEYDTKKSFGITKSHLRVSKNPILSTYLVTEADFVACHNTSYIEKYDIVSEIREGGTFLLNCDYDAQGLEQNIPAEVKRLLFEKTVSFYVIDANKISRKLGLGDRVNIVLQAAFFKLFDMIPLTDAVTFMEQAVEETYLKKGRKIIEQNLKAIEAGLNGLTKIEIPQSWGEATRQAEPCESVPDSVGGAEQETQVDSSAAIPEQENSPAVVGEQNSFVGNSEQITEQKKLLEFIEKILIPINALKGDDLPVSAFLDYSDGTMPFGTSAFEKRGIATMLPAWKPDLCLQCNKCAFVCPHAAIRPYLLDEKEQSGAPAGFATVPAIGKDLKDYAYSLQLSDMDCTGCGSCANVCPAKEKALNMVLASELDRSPAHWTYALSITEKDEVANNNSVKSTQFKQPLYEFSGACAGCGETSYAKLLTQMFGDKMYWVNATGCSQAWGASMPSIPYTKNKNGQGPAWSNSLFENNAEFGYGMLLSSRQQRLRVREQITALYADLQAGQGSAAGAVISTDPGADPDRRFAVESETIGELISAIDAWLSSFDDLEQSQGASKELAQALNSLLTEGDAALRERAASILKCKDQFAKKTVWMFGGDGWAYDIGYGGLDHVIATGEDINVFIIDTEVYSNTGGQSSKATPLGAVAQFQSSGKKSPKKNIGKQMISYGNVYVASVSMGADPGQLLKAIREAESYHGPSIIIAYTPCIMHGIKAGMHKVQDEMKRAVESGYWPLYRYDPRKEHPFQLDSDKRTLSFRDFLDGEVRYASLEITYPENAEQLFRQAEANAEKDFLEYQNMK